MKLAVIGAILLGLIGLSAGLVIANSGETRSDRPFYICEDTSTPNYMDWLPHEGGYHLDQRAELTQTNCPSSTRVYHYVCWLESRLPQHHPNSTAGWPTFTLAGSALAINAGQAEAAVRKSRGWDQYTRNTVVSILTSTATCRALAGTNNTQAVSSALGATNEYQAWLKKELPRVAALFSASAVSMEKSGHPLRDGCGEY